MPSTEETIDMQLRMGVLVLVAICPACSTKTNHADPTQSKVTVDRTIDVVANGKDKVNITVSVLDTADVPAAGEAVTLVVSGHGNTVTPPTLSDKNGRSTATLTSTVAEMKTITVKVISFMDGSLSEISNNATVSFIAGAAAKLQFDQQPSASSEGFPIKPAVKVGVYDVNGNNVGVLDPGTPVSLFLIAGTPGAMLGGATTVTSTVGEAEFDDLDVQTAGTGYRLTAVAGDLTPAASNTFDITPLGGP
jgi:hypothetical protein